eukprot:Gregarina_sp_Poly_1__8242@NODE_47_length_17802_cov_82_087454_g41_i0_p3_GENE_NODE_47_length_17802_cov_82_087454_g41_i0NODE_47_length_17802_cov_82_087454_g41_i0_p3_ORF_typecomplete_len301_score41_96CHD5/PF04420_14/5_2e05_NODE_47_length_17802_cov_82_087454_g41_i012432145
MILVSDWLFLSQLATFAIFEIANKWCKQRTPSPSPASAFNVPEAAPVRNLEGCHPVYVELCETQAAARQLDSPSTFVEHAKAKRKANALERQWQQILTSLPLSERLKYNEMSQPGRSIVSSTDIPDARMPSMFAQVMNPDLSEADRAQLYNSIRMQFQQGSSSANAQSAILRYGSLLKLVMAWVLIHLLVGWQASVRSLPLFAFPAAAFGRLGGPRFPLSLISSRTPPQNIFKYALDMSYVGSESNFESASSECTNYLSISFFMIMLVFSVALGHAKAELFGKTGKLKRGLHAIQQLRQN